MNTNSPGEYKSHGIIHPVNDTFRIGRGLTILRVVKIKP